MEAGRTSVLGLSTYTKQSQAAVMHFVILPLELPSILERHPSCRATVCHSLVVVPGHVIIEASKEKWHEAGCDTHRVAQPVFAASPLLVPTQ
jgi:hypothetical protein